MRAPGNEISVIIVAGSHLCLVRLGLGRGTRITVRRVGLGGCHRHFTLSNLPVAGIKIGFSDTARGVAS